MPKPRTIISLFSGALGLDLGLARAGFSLRAVAECDEGALESIDLNLKRVSHRPVVRVSEKLTEGNVAQVCQEIVRRARLKVGAVGVLAGAPPCQPFSTAGRRLSLKDERASGFDIMFRAIELLRPRYFVIENVRGVMSAALKHRPLIDRGTGSPPLKPSEEHGSAFRRILRQLTELCGATGYCATWGVLNAADFGVAQKRERLVIIGTSDGKSIWPEPTHSDRGRVGLHPWANLRSALVGLAENDSRYLAFNENTRQYLRLIPQGGNWRSLPARVQERAIGGAYHSWGGRSGFLRRLTWNEPSPTVTNNPRGRATMLCHPTKARPLSIRECARIQGFPDDWEFSGSITEQYRQIGNATPVGLGEAIGRAIAEAMRDPRLPRFHGEVLCSDVGLLQRLSTGPRTTLSPGSARPTADRLADGIWLGKPNRGRGGFANLKARPALLADSDDRVSFDA